MLASLPIPHMVALALSAGAAFTDARTGHIPNELTLPPLVVAPLAYLVLAGPQMAALSIVSAILCALLPYLMFRKGAAGGGDVKLLAAMGAVSGASFGIEAQLFGFALATFASLALLAYRGRLLATLANSLFLAINPVLPSRYRRIAPPEALSTIRMGIPFFLGALLAFWLRA
ncbi:MAG: prepilin peptidase [Myxococcales bacterium]|nr:prepilin peptidase [Myxococcales bacterium]